MELAETMMAVKQGQWNCFGGNLVPAVHYFAFISSDAVLC